MLKALASDIDGTLYFHDHQPPIKENDLQAIKEFQNNGHLFGLCSGRPLGGVLNLSNNLKLDFYIAVSGAVILDKAKKIVFERVIDNSYIEELYHQYKDDCCIIIANDSLDHVYKNKLEFTDDKALIFNDLNDIKDSKIYGISLVFKDEKQANKHCQIINQKYPLIEGFQNKNAIDIVSKGCSKGQAVCFVKEYYQIDSMAGIGDSYNDITLLKAVDQSFTFPISPDVLKNNASFIVKDINEAINILI